MYTKQRAMRIQLSLFAEEKHWGRRESRCFCFNAGCGLPIPSFMVQEIPLKSQGSPAKTSGSLGKQMNFWA